MTLPAPAQEIADQIDAALDASNPALDGESFLGYLETEQAAYLLQNGNYFQGLELVPQIPNDGVGIAPDHSTSPSDQSESWADVIPPSALPNELISRPAIDIYSLATGIKDYSLRLDFRSDGIVYRRTIGFLAHNWKELDQ